MDNGLFELIIYEHSTDSQKYKPNVDQTFVAFMKREFKFMSDYPSINQLELTILAPGEEISSH